MLFGYLHVSSKIAVCILLVPRVGLEPTHRKALDPKSSASTNFATPAFAGYRLTCGECSFHLVPFRYYDFFGGEGGIRTPGTLPYASFQDWSIRPLCHLSMFGFVPH